jgi:hypothetical protein
MLLNVFVFVLTAVDLECCLDLLNFCSDFLFVEKKNNARVGKARDELTRQTETLNIK